MPGTPLRRLREISTARFLRFAAGALIAVGLGACSSDGKKAEKAAADPKAVSELMEKMAAARNAGNLIGEYTASLPGAPSSGAKTPSPAREIRLRLAIDGVAEMSTDYLDGNPPVVRAGHWEAINPEQARVTLSGSNGAAEAPLTLQRQGFSLIAVDVDRKEWGTSGLRLLSTHAPAPHVGGTVLYRERVALTPAATLLVVLEDVSARETLARQIIRSPGQVPIVFELRYDPARINPSNTYIVWARILENGQVRFATSESVRVLTQGNPSQLELLVHAVAGP